MKALFDLPAPAKINLFLHLVGRRPDGYHLLQSVFCLLDWQDTLDLEWRPGPAISREDLTVALPPDDLITRAAKVLQQATGCSQGVHVRVSKSVPAQAGMGGGSSDAATCLIGLNRLWNLGLSRLQLCELGLSLGADVPFFIGGHNAWVEGIGDQLTPLHIPKANFLVIKPASGIATKEIFTAKDLKRDSKAATITGFAADATAPFGFGQNDLQSVAVRLCPEVGAALDWLDSVGLKGRMTGSGSAVFAVVPSDLHQQAVIDRACAQQQRLQVLAGQPQWQYRFCKSLDRHPLFDWVA